MNDTPHRLKNPPLFLASAVMSSLLWFTMSFSVVNGWDNGGGLHLEDYSSWVKVFFCLGGNDGAGLFRDPP